MKKKNSKIKVSIVYDQKDVCAIYAYQDFLTKHVGAGDKIPARVLRKFLSFFEYEDNTIQKEIEERCLPIKNKVEERFIADREYHFNKKLEIPDVFYFEPNEDITIGKKAKRKIVKGECSLTELINYVFNQKSKFSEKIHKDEFAINIYSTINTYFDQFKGNTLKLFTDYKRIVLTAFILHKWGFPLSKDIQELEGREPSNQLLFQAVKYHLKKKKKQNRAN